MLSTRSRLYANEHKMETLHKEVKNGERENILLQEKLRHLQSELAVSNNKTNKYKRIAKNFKANLDQIEETLATLKRLSQEENKTLQ